MNVIQRVREIGVLRAVGMTRRQVYRKVVEEAGIIGLMGDVLGCLTGLVLGVLMIGLAAGLPGVATIQVPLLILAFAAAFGIAVSMIAAIYPARLAAGMSIVRAVQYE
jgi:putative ABC transport system permease protein